VTFISQSSVMPYSSFSVMLDGACAHSEVADFKSSTVPGSSPDAESVFCYSTTLVPRYWRQLCESADPTRYSIIHDIIQHSTPSSSSGSERKLLFSVEYRFNYVDSPPPSPDDYDFGFPSSAHPYKDGTEQIYPRSDDFSQNLLGNLSSMFFSDPCAGNVSPLTTSVTGLDQLHMLDLDPASAVAGGNSQMKGPADFLFHYPS